MKNFLWLLQDNPFLGKRPFSCECIVPPACKPENPALLAGCDLWIGVRRNGESGLVARLRVAEISEYEEGMYARHLLVSGNPALSLWISAARDGAFPVSGLTTMPSEAITEISEDTANELRGMLREGTRAAPMPHTSKILQRIPVPRKVQTETRHIAAQLALTRKHIPYEDIHRWEKHPIELSPHESVALSKIAAELPEISGAADALVVLRAHRGVKLEWTDRVDDEFRDIDPKKIVARKFIASAPDISLGFSLEKTEEAEKRHQHILRDVATHLLNSGMCPKESGSIDLALEIGEKIFVAEIKSATWKNFLSQGSKGLFQALSYAIAIRNAGWERVVEMLIMERKGADDDIHRLSQVGEKCGVRIFLYNEDEPWPERVEGLADFLSEKDK